MANGKTHAIASIVVAAQGVYQLPTDAAGLAWCTGAILATIITPDLDLLDSSGNYSLYIIRETFSFSSVVSSFAEKAWAFYWYPYSKSLSHRSFISHFPIISTLIRLLYFAPFTALLVYLFGFDFQYLLIAMIAADICHFVMDWRLWRVIGAFTQ